MLNKEVRFIMLALLFGIPGVAIAGTCAQSNNKVGFVGLDSAGGAIYVDVSEHSNQCGCNYVRFYPENSDTDKVLSILLAARLTEKRVRIDINDSNSCNSGYRVYIQ
ncbi:hypothetical protein P886_1484 [Alteromonadaceae bacterium 2753L.S.0a.02]|nr:hypothetical protein P886_1484 [Alteromonadaceae bacterium 2753L.S.0a.02]